LTVSNTTTTYKVVESEIGAVEDETTFSYFYTGTFSNGKPNGTGKFEYSDGRIYEGEVADGQPHGRGTMTLKNKKVQTGNFVNGEFKIP
jgi:hypothetical protein